jgi:hypothetical protein
MTTAREAHFRAFLPSLLLLLVGAAAGCTALNSAPKLGGAAGGGGTDASQNTGGAGGAGARDGGVDVATAGAGGASVDGSGASAGTGSGGAAGTGAGGAADRGAGGAGVGGSGASAGTGGGGPTDAGADAGADRTGTGGSGTAGASGAGGSRGSGGTVGTGGTGAGGAGGAPECLAGATQCSGASLETCDANGQWGAVAGCPTRQTCTGPAGTAACTCVVDAVCGAVGPVCAQSSTLLASCMQDGNGCLFEASAMTCDNGACAGSPGAASCCTNTCTAGTAQCLSSSSVQACMVAGNGCRASVTTSCGGGTLCERYPPAACVNPSWAEWPMPNGQVDVATGAPNRESYTDNGDSTVTDNVTALMWQKTAPTTSMTQAAAVAYCPTLTLGGHNDWRLPTLIELLSLVDSSTSEPAINVTYFPGAPDSAFWTSTLYAAASAYGLPAGAAWHVSFGDGSAGGVTTPTTTLARCVR